MGREFTGRLVGRSEPLAIVVSRFNEFITGKLLSGALDELVRHGVPREKIDVAWVPGAVEIPLRVHLTSLQPNDREAMSRKRACRSRLRQAQS